MLNLLQGKLQMYLNTKLASKKEQEFCYKDPGTKKLVASEAK